MTELTGLELRKAACEALGWKCQLSPLNGYRHFHVLNGVSVMGSGPRPNAAWRDAPAIESDPAVSEPMFLEWCVKNGFMWDLYQTPQREQPISCAVYRQDLNGVMAHVFGATPSEARARAIVAAQEKS